MSRLNALYTGKFLEENLKSLLSQHFSLKQEDELNPPPCHVLFVDHESLQSPKEVIRIMKSIPKKVHKILVFSQENVSVDFSELLEWNFDYYLSPPFSDKKIKKLSEKIFRYPKITHQSNLKEKIETLKNKNLFLQKEMQLLHLEMKKLQIEDSHAAVEQLIPIRRDCVEKTKNIQKILSLFELPGIEDRHHQYFQVIENNTRLLQASMRKLSQNLKARKEHLYLSV